MKFKKQTILIISPESWEAQFVSKHHYAITLSKYNKVYFLNPPTDKNAIKESEYKNLYIVDYISIKGLRFLPKFLRVYLDKRFINRLESRINLSFDVVWLFENSRFYNMEFALDRLKIYHQVDLIQNFYPKEASISSDISFCTTDSIKNRLLKYSSNIYKIDHGLSLIDIPKIIKKSNDIEVACVGNLDRKYFDIELISKLIDTNIDINFNFIGKCSSNNILYLKYKDYKNVKFYGKVASKDILPILSTMDILILVYRYTNQEEKDDLSNPHKLMEYLASGKVCVATFTKEYEDKRDLLKMVDNNREYLDAFREVIVNLDYYNGLDLQSKRIAFAHSNTYPKQIEKIERLIGDSLC